MQVGLAHNLHKSSTRAAHKFTKFIFYTNSYFFLLLFVIVSLTGDSGSGGEQYERSKFNHGSGASKLSGSGVEKFKSLTHVL